jgi:hypothetical protein
VGNIQVAATKRKDRLQARCIAVAIVPELLDLKVQHERAVKIISEELPKVVRAAIADIVPVIISVRIAIPPLLNRSVDQLYLIDEAGPTLLQLISVTLQFNDLVQTLAEHILQRVVEFDPVEHQKDLSGQLRVIGQDIADAERLITPIHNEATATT